jgi:hypothetical protein
LRRSIEVAVAGLTGYEQVAIAIVTFVGVAIMVAARAALEALRARHPRRVAIALSLLLLYALALVLATLARQRGNGLEIPLDVIFTTTTWVTAAAIVIATVYVFWRALAERLLTLREACSAVLISVTFGTAWVTVLRAAGVPLAAMSLALAAGMLLPTLLPLTVAALAPLALSRVRHM